MQEESPEGGRFKKEIFIDNQSYLLLIRDEGGMPEMQVGVFPHRVCVCCVYTERLNFQFHTLRTPFYYIIIIRNNWIDVYF